jgi:hypothetical protein
MFGGEVQCKIPPACDFGVRWLATALVSPRTAASENGSLGCSACSARPKRWQATALQDCTEVVFASSDHAPAERRKRDPQGPVRPHTSRQTVSEDHDRSLGLSQDGILLPIRARVTSPNSSTPNLGSSGFRCSRRLGFSPTSLKPYPTANPRFLKKRPYSFEFCCEQVIGALRGHGLGRCHNPYLWSWFEAHDAWVDSQRRALRELCGAGVSACILISTTSWAAGTAAPQTSWAAGTAAPQVSPNWRRAQRRKFDRAIPATSSSCPRRGRAVSQDSPR